MKELKIHKYQDHVKLNGERPMFAVCGVMWPQLTDDWDKVTCKNCIRKKIKKIKNEKRLS